MQCTCICTRNGLASEKSSQLLAFPFYKRMTLDLYIAVFMTLKVSCMFFDKEIQTKGQDFNSMSRYGDCVYYKDIINRTTLNSLLIIHMCYHFITCADLFSGLTIITHYVVQYPVKSTTST
jgi:hypothetical protein